MLLNILNKVMDFIWKFLYEWWIIIIKIFFRLGDLDIISIDWGNGYYVYCVKIIYLKLNSVLVVLYYIFKD